MVINDAKVRCPHRGGYSRATPRIEITAANEQERAKVGELAQDTQQVTGDRVELVFVDQGYTGAQPAAQAAEHGMRLEVVKLQ